MIDRKLPSALGGMFDDSMKHFDAAFGVTASAAHDEVFALTPLPGSVSAPSAQGLLRDAAQAIDDRAAMRDLDDGERSMKRTVEAFHALTGVEMTERDGWLFMAILKAARATAGEVVQDDYVDGAAYFALAGESALRGL